MADVRALLRQQRATRRIEHPYAAYSDGGKLLCTLCHETIKADSLWDTHIRSPGHRARVQTSSKPATAQKSTTTTLSDEALLAQALGKRKHTDSDGDESMEDDETEEDLVRKKRSRQDISSPVVEIATNGSKKADKDKDSSGEKRPTPTLTPLNLARRTSGTPAHGVELQIPSRPATPNPNSANGTSASSTPKNAPLGRSPLIPQEATMASTTATAGFTSATTPASTAIAATSSAAAGPSSADIDDADWAAFESEVVNAVPAAGGGGGGATSTTFAGNNNDNNDNDNDAIISAAPMSAAELVTKSEEEERARRRLAADIELEDEKEEATRALEEEFEEMEELEARVRRLKEKREAVRRPSMADLTGGTKPGGGDEVAAAAAAAAAGGKENVNGQSIQEEEEEEEDEEDEEEGDDDWVGFRFRG